MRLGLLSIPVGIGCPDAIGSADDSDRAGGVGCESVLRLWLSTSARLAPASRQTGEAERRGRP